MKRSEIINNLKGLADLSELARSYYSGNVGEWVGLGLLTEDEYVEFRKGWEAESYVSQLMKEAEEALPRVNLLDRDDLPKEYRAIVERMAELKPLVDADKAVSSILRNMKEHTRSGQTIGATWGLGNLAERALDVLKTAEDDLREEYGSLDMKKDPKERNGTIVQRIRHSIFDEYESARRKARADASADAMTHEFEGTTIKARIQRKNELDRIVDDRRDAKVAPIREAMKKVLEDALKGGRS